MSAVLKMDGVGKNKEGTDKKSRQSNTEERKEGCGVGGAETALTSIRYMELVRARHPADEL